MKQRILLVEDQSMLRGALEALLSMEDDLEVVATAANGREALAKLDNVEADIVLTDIEMPHMTGLELAAAVKQRTPTPKVVILTTFARAGYLRRALDVGVRGYLLKDAPSEELALALRQVAAGKRVVDPELAMESLDAIDPLTDRERQALRAAAEGKTTQQIATSLHLSEGTIRNYLSEAISKLNAANRIDAARIARHKGWL
ncbi:MAG: response regulator transcription factor [Gammaproteobacteria bacterium]